jgi:thioredoxin reductase (NADPH)
MTNQNVEKVIIVGSGPAGYTAAIYTSRANLNPLCFEGYAFGGQLMLTTEVENFPGFPEGIQGPEMMPLFRKQAERFGTRFETVHVTKLDLKSNPKKVWFEDKEYLAQTVIIATGATAKYLGLPSETKFSGFGVSACATCDGAFFKNKKVIVVGGGDSAMEEANFLTRFADHVTIVHRKDTFRASKIMVDRAKNHPKISFMLDSAVEEVLGEEKPRKVVKGVKIKNLKTNQIIEMPIDGIFIAIGHQPNTELVKGQIDLDEKGYIKTKPGRTETNIPGVFAAGDVQDHYYRQAITAAGSGCQAAIEVERYLEALGV